MKLFLRKRLMKLFFKKKVDETRDMEVEELVE
jgi:hypothetical protein